MNRSGLAWIIVGRGRSAIVLKILNKLIARPITRGGDLKKRHNFQVIAVRERSRECVKGHFKEKFLLSS